MDNFNLYKDIQARTNGEIYIGVVGPVRAGKSTFIKRFMDLMVLPQMEDEHGKARTRDELPQSAAGKTIMTTEPKFIPKEAAQISLGEEAEVKIRLIDCVGYMVEGATGHTEGEQERQVKTPWYDYEIPFTQAAEIGTRKVINEHATIGVVVTTDGSFGELERESYLSPEEKTIQELQKLGKPFIVLVNSEKPFSEQAIQTATELEQKYGVTALPVNCEQLRKDDINHIMESILYEFPIVQMEFYIPKWVEMLSREHKVKADIIRQIRELMKKLNAIKDITNENIQVESEFIKKMKIDKIQMQNGCVKIGMDVDDKYYYEMISEFVGAEVSGEYQFMAMIRELAQMKKEYMKVQDAINAVNVKGYGVVSPDRSEIQMEDPVIIKQGNKYGVKIKSEAPSIHMIKANIETEIAPIVGSEQQAEDLIAYIKETSQSEEGIWSTNIFGKSIDQMVEDGIHSKLSQISDESQLKLQETMQKIVNDSNGGLVCIII